MLLSAWQHCTLAYLFPSSTPESGSEESSYAETILGYKLLQSANQERYLRVVSELIIVIKIYIIIYYTLFRSKHQTYTCNHISDILANRFF